MASTEGQNTGGQQQQQSSDQQNQGGQQVQGQQQLQLQQSTPSQQNTQQQQQNQQMQQQLVIQQQQPYLQQIFNSQGQPQLQLMPGNIGQYQLTNSLQNQIQVIAAGKSFQPNQLSNPHMLTTATGYIPTSGANQSYIIGNIGQILNSNQPSISLQQHQHQGKPGEMQKVIQPQITQTQLPQGLTWAPQFLQNQIFQIRGTQPDQQPMFIQQQQPLHNSTQSHQQFTMPLTATSQPNGLQQNAQNTQQNNQVTVQQSQAQAIQPNGNVMSMSLSMKGATLQPKPLQIQPSPSTPTNQQQGQQQVHHQQQLQTAQLQNVNVTMGGQQFQMIPQQGQQILTQSPQTITTQVIPQGQQQRQLILPQQTGGQQQVTFIQQPQQQQQIRPNYTVTPSTVTPTSQQGGPPTTSNAPVKTPKIRKPGVGRGTPNQQNAQSPNQGNKVVYPRPTLQNSGGQIQIQSKMGSTTPTGATITRVSVPGAVQQHNMQMQQQQQQQQQPLKTINISQLHTPPTLPDATLTPLIPQNNSQITATLIPPPVQQVQLFTTTQLPTPNISITPTPLLAKKEENCGGADNTGEHRGRETEKENTKVKSTPEEGDDSKHKLPKALVKPQAQQILTHVIEGFVIQEASEPFPPVHKNGECDEPPKKKMAISGPASEKGKCEMCGKIDLKSKFRKNKRLCSSCSKSMRAQQNHQQNMNNSIKGKNKKWSETGDGELTDSTTSSMDTCHSPIPRSGSEVHDEDPKMNPVKWGVSDVVDFVRNLPGCSEYADDFAVQEIDGQALMLLKEDHLMSAIGMKLGPALKLCAKIEALRVANGGTVSEQSKS